MGPTRCQFQLDTPVWPKEVVVLAVLAVEVCRSHGGLALSTVVTLPANFILFFSPITSLAHPPFTSLPSVFSITIRNISFMSMEASPNIPLSPRTLDPFDPRNMALSSYPPGHTSSQEDKDDLITLATPATPDNSGVVDHSDIQLDDLARQETAQDIDLLIAELEEEDGKEPDPEVVSITEGTGPRHHADLLETDINMGLNDAEVIAARRKYGRNCLKQERQSNLLKFFKLFVGPVQFVMEVCTCTPFAWPLKGD